MKNSQLLSVEQRSPLLLVIDHIYVIHPTKKTSPWKPVIQEPLLFVLSLPF